MNPVIADVLARQVRSLGRIYLVMGLCVVGIVVVTLVLGVPELAVLDADVLLWAEAGLAALAVLLLGLVLPLVRRRLMDPGRVRVLGPDTLRSWGLSAEIDPIIARQAIFLTRYTAGCVISWGLAASVALYGLVASMLGARPPVTGGFLAASVFVLVLLPPRGGWIEGALERLAHRS